VLVSAFATRGLCADVLRLILDEHELVLGEIVLAEVERGLRKKLRLPEDIVAQDLAVLRRYPVHPTASPRQGSPISDPDDARVLATALAAGAEVLVTGDAELLDVREQVEGITVINPRGFWEMHRGTGT
jgi:predicted nucleic acid-binding protein